MGHRLAARNLLICSLYGILSICQTLNSRALYKDLHFDYYSFTFAIQRIVVIAVFSCYGSNHLNFKRLLKVLPFSACMCASTFLSSYCLTVMPLAAFLAFKKLIVLFIMAISCSLSLPVRTNSFQNICVVGIVAGGIMVGERDMLAGDSIGYAACLLFNLSEALLLQYSAYLCRNDGFEPSELQFYHAVISLPYFVSAIVVEDQAEDIFTYFSLHGSLHFYLVFSFAVFLAVTSELSSNWIAMKISPFEKSTVSNIKDLVLMLVSVYFFHDLLVTWVSGLGIVVCLLSSALFSIPFLEREEPVPHSIPEEGQNFMEQIEADIEGNQIMPQENSPSELADHL